MRDRRQRSKVADTFDEMLRERVFAIACGYEDANDLDALRSDPALKLACERKPLSGRALASQPTISRMENGLRPRDLLAMATAMAERVIAQLPADTHSVVLDVDATDDPCHGQQEFEFFNGHYDTHCYLPLHVSVTGPDKVHRLLVSARCAFGCSKLPRAWGELPAHLAASADFLCEQGCRGALAPAAEHGRDLNGEAQHNRGQSTSAGRVAHAIPCLCGPPSRQNGRSATRILPSVAAMAHRTTASGAVRRDPAALSSKRTDFGHSHEWCRLGREQAVDALGLRWHPVVDVEPAADPRANRGSQGAWPTEVP